MSEPTTTMPTLEELLSSPPASFQFSKSDDGTRTIGTSAGIVVDITADRVEAAALFPPDNAELAERNGVLLLLLLTYLRPDWQSAGSWLATQMQLAARTKKPFDSQNFTRRVTFAWQAIASRATLRIRQ